MATDVLKSEDDGFIIFLYMKPTFSASHLRWTYELRSEKALLPFDPALSKLAKNGMASLCSLAARQNSSPFDARALSQGRYQSYVNRVWP